MDFINSTDWLNREAPYAFKLDHILFVVIGVLIGVGLCFLLRKKEQKTIKIVLVSLWSFAILVEIVYYGLVYAQCIMDPVGHPFNIEYDLPLHSCLMFLYVFPFALFSKNKVIRTAAMNFSVVINMIIGFITLFVGCPPKGSSALSFVGIQSMVIHVIIVIVPLIMLITNYYDLKKGDLKWGLMLFGILAISIYIFDAVAGCDYFYFYDGRTFGVLYVISENVPHLVWTLIVVTCYVLTGIIIHYLVYGIKVFIDKQKSSKESTDKSIEEN